MRVTPLPPDGGKLKGNNRLTHVFFGFFINLMMVIALLAMPGQWVRKYGVKKVLKKNDSLSLFMFSTERDIP